MGNLRKSRGTKMRDLGAIAIAMAVARRSQCGCRVSHPNPRRLPMRKMSTALLTATALLAGACTAAPGEPALADPTAAVASEKRVTPTTAKADGPGSIEGVSYTGTGCAG